MKNKLSGFTLIELVVVIVILGILAVTALPKFVDLSSDARKAATQGVAGALSSASSINYSAAIARGAVNGATYASTTAHTNVVDTETGCNNTVAAALMAAGVSFAATGAGTYNVVTASGPATIGASAPCTVQNNDDTTQTATFTLIGAK